MNKYIIKVFTSEEDTESFVSAMAENPEELQTIASEEAESNFYSIDIYDTISNLMFGIPSADELTEEQWQEMYDNEHNYYGYEIIEVNTPKLEEEFENYYLIN